MKNFLFGSILILVASLTVVAQSPMPVPPFGDYQQPVQPLEQKWNELLGDLRRNQRFSADEPRLVKKGLLAPTANDWLNSAVFLRTPDTGLIVLLPERIRDQKFLESHKEIHVLGAGSFYSFAQHSHGLGYASDIKLENGNLITGVSPFSFGVFRDLGDVPLENLTLDDPRTEFLSAYQAPRTPETARADAARMRQGAQVDGAVYRREVPIQLNSTFLLRSITYRFLHGSDVLVALRVLRKDTDGGIVIGWKRLKKYPEPHKYRNRSAPAPQIRTNRWPIR
jgi:hypothetical protein